MKTKKGLLLFSTLVLLSGCSLIAEDEAPSTNNENTGVENVEKEDNNIHNVGPKEVIERIENKDTFSFVVASSSCPACMAYEKELGQVEKSEGVTTDYLDLDKLTADDQEDITKLMFDLVGMDENDQISTPTTYFVEDGKIVDNEIGVIESDDLIDEYIEYFD